jgi:hypothetical protein
MIVFIFFHGEFRQISAQLDKAIGNNRAVSETSDVEASIS